MNYKKIALYIAIFLGGFMVAKLLSRGEDSQEKMHENHAHTSSNQTWTCSMHPSVRQPDPGKCPICGMDLIPANSSESDASPIRFEMTAQAKQLAQIQTTEIKKQVLQKTLRFNGKLAFDQRKKVKQVAHIGGRLEKLLINFSGETVRKGQKIAEIYSPELVAAQQELLSALQNQSRYPELLQAARQKLQLWKLSEEQITLIENEKAIIEHFPIYADYNGVVSNLLVTEGNHVMQGGALFELSSTSQLWALVEVYEEDLPLLKTGQSVSFSIAGNPRKEAGFYLDFIEPEVNPQTHVAIARVNIPKAQAGWKAGTLISAEVKVEAASTLSVPYSAVLWTGSRSVVYVETDKGYSIKEIQLGTAYDGFYEVLEGLEEGEKVVSNGTFTVDAAAQLHDKKSMLNHPKSMEMEKAKPMPVEVIQLELPKLLTKTSAPWVNAIKSWTDSYLELKDEFVASKSESAQEIASKWKKDFNSFGQKPFSREMEVYWQKEQANIKDNLSIIAGTNLLEKQRNAFLNLSESMIRLQKLIGQQKLYVQWCPMANQDKGGNWLSLSDEVLNPYFGEVMLTCGMVTDTLGSTND